MTLMRDDFDNVSIEKFEDLKEQNDAWTQSDLRDIQDYVKEHHLHDFKLYRTNDAETIYLLINNDPTNYVTKPI